VETNTVGGSGLRRVSWRCVRRSEIMKEEREEGRRRNGERRGRGGRLRQRRSGGRGGGAPCMEHERIVSSRTHANYLSTQMTISRGGAPSVPYQGQHLRIREMPEPSPKLMSFLMEPILLLLPIFIPLPQI